LVALLAAPQVSAEPSRETAGWAGLTLDAARDKARAEGRGLLLAYVADWSAASSELEAALADTRIRKLIAARLVAVRFDVMARPEEATALHVKIVPTVILLGPDGTELERWTEARRAAAFAHEIERALAGGTSLDRAHDLGDSFDGYSQACLAHRGPAGASG
jgi:thiol:disulfide interchange protein